VHIHTVKHSGDARACNKQPGSGGEQGNGVAVGKRCGTVEEADEERGDAAGEEGGALAAEVFQAVQGGRQLKNEWEESG